MINGTDFINFDCNSFFEKKNTYLCQIPFLYTIGKPFVQLFLPKLIFIEKNQKNTLSFSLVNTDIRNSFSIKASGG